MKLWITGGAGLLGSLLHEICGQRQIMSVATTRAEVDITNLDAVMRFVETDAPTHIVNCAAYTAVDQAEKEQELAFAVNAHGAENLAKAARKHKLKLLHVSTNFVFDGTSLTPYAEEDVANPISVYGLSKWEGEKRVLGHYDKACIVRTSWLFGKKLGKNFLSKVLENLQKETVLRVSDDQVARATYAQDLAEALLALLDQKGIFHFANHEPVSRYQVACDVKAEAEKRGIALACQEIVPVSSKEFVLPARRPENGVLATRKIEQHLPIRSWRSALGEFIC